MAQIPGGIDLLAEVGEADLRNVDPTIFGTLFEGDSLRDQASAVRDQFARITADCKSALGSA